MFLARGSVLYFQVIGKWIRRRSIFQKDFDGFHLVSSFFWKISKTLVDRIHILGIHRAIWFPMEEEDTMLRLPI